MRTKGRSMMAFSVRAPGTNFRPATCPALLRYLIYAGWGRSSYTSYTHSQQSYGSGGGGYGRARSRYEDFDMNQNDFAQWYQQRSDIFDDLDRMFREVRLVTLSSVPLYFHSLFVYSYAFLSTSGSSLAFSSALDTTHE